MVCTSSYLPAHSIAHPLALTCLLTYQHTQVHLHEQAGLVYVDSGGGSVTAWLSPQGGPLGLQVKAAGGVGLDPALKVGCVCVTGVV